MWSTCPHERQSRYRVKTRSPMYSAAMPALGLRIAPHLPGRNNRMPLLNLIVILIVVGVGLHLINRYVPMASSIKTILNLVVIVVVCVWLLQATGLWAGVTS